MKRIILVLMILALAIPAGAQVVITAYNESWKGQSTPGDCNIVHVKYDFTSETNDVRAFALNIGLVDTNDTNNALIDYVLPTYQIGECNATDRGYGIFPGSIQIDGSGNVTDYGSPVVGETVDGSGFIDVNATNMIIEMGSLYTGANSPPKSGELLQFRVNDKFCSVVITENTQRGGVVMENPNESVSYSAPRREVYLPGDITRLGGDGSRDGKVLMKDYLVLSANYKKSPLPDPRADLCALGGKPPDGKCLMVDYLLLSAWYKTDWQ